MLDLKNLPKEIVLKSMIKRGVNVNVDHLYETHDTINNLKKSLELLYAERNLKGGSADLKIKIKTMEQNIHECETEHKTILSNIPNIIADDVPEGQNETHNTVMETHGQIIFHKHHYDMGIFEINAMLNSRYVILKSHFSQLERALGMFMMDTLKHNGFVEYGIPFILNDQAFINSGHMKDVENMFQVSGGYLIPTGEVGLVNLGYEKKYDTLPVKMCTLTSCFRKEAGAAGKDTKGLIRLHQFQKCEMVGFANEETSDLLFDSMLNSAKQILELLHIPYRLVKLCAGDIGFGAYRTIDIEVPIGGVWREISSISHCHTFQSFNMNLKDAKTKKLLYTFNGSGLAVGRTLATLLEVHYDPIKQIINIPDVLRKYVDFTEIKI